MPTNWRPDMPWEAYKREMVDHYAQMASDPAWKKYVEEQMRIYAKEHPSEFGDLPERLTEVMRKRKEQQ